MIIRYARPSDARICATLIYSAAPQKYDYWLGAFGDDPITVLKQAFEANAGVLGYRYYWVIEVNDSVVAGGAFYTHKQANKATRSLLWWLWHCYGTKKMPTLIKRALTLAQLQKPMSDNIWYVGNIAVLKDWQGQGLATNLLTSQELHAKKLGLNFGLDVATTNIKAQRLYERLGFRMMETKVFRGDASANIPDAIRMLKSWQ